MLEVQDQPALLAVLALSTSSDLATPDMLEAMYDMAWHDMAANWLRHCCTTDSGCLFSCKVHDEGVLLDMFADQWLWDGHKSRCQMCSIAGGMTANAQAASQKA